MDYDFDTVIDRLGTCLVKWHLIAAFINGSRIDYSDSQGAPSDNRLCRLSLVFSNRYVFGVR